MPAILGSSESGIKRDVWDLHLYWERKYLQLPPFCAAAQNGEVVAHAQRHRTERWLRMRGSLFIWILNTDEWACPLKWLERAMHARPPLVLCSHSTTRMRAKRTPVFNIGAGPTSGTHTYQASMAYPEPVLCNVMATNHETLCHIPISA